MSPGIAKKHPSHRSSATIAPDVSRRDANFSESTRSKSIRVSVTDAFSACANRCLSVSGSREAGPAGNAL